MDLKKSEVTEAKSSIEEPPELELKYLPSHLEYVFLEENNKLPVIIAKGLKNDEKDTLLKVLKSHKRAISWKITDIKGTDPHFCTHKILMEDDYKPTVQSQRRVNPKIQEVIKKEVLKLLDAVLRHEVEAFSSLYIMLARTMTEAQILLTTGKGKWLEVEKVTIEASPNQRSKNLIFNVEIVSRYDSDRVLLFNSCLKIFSGKLKTRWSGPFTITKVFPYGTIELSQPDGPNFKVNGHRVKHYFGGDLPPKEVQDLHTLPKDK
ncbi:hypothetical protein Tco_0904189 [Tanacetum coccineum]